MKTIWIWPPAWPRGEEDVEEKRRRYVKRGLALVDAVDPENGILYASAFAEKRAIQFAEAVGLQVLPLDEAQGEVRMICDDPFHMEGEILRRTGEAVTFARPSAVLSTEVEDGEILLWQLPASDWIFLQYPQEPYVPPRKGSGLSLYSLMLPAIEGATGTMRKNLQKFLANPEEPEGVHQLRVSIRSFRALISLVKPLLPPEVYASMQDVFRQLGRKCARLRELDVLIEEWEAAKGEGDANLRRALDQERKDEMNLLVGIMQDPLNQQIIASAANRLILNLEPTNWQEIDGVLYIDQRLHSWYRFSLEGLWRMDGFDWPVAHKIRLKSKKYRYIAEHFKDHMTSVQTGRHKAAKKRQTVLGEICDSLRNQEAVEELMPHLPEEATEEADRFILREKDREMQLRELVGTREETPPNPGQFKANHTEPERMKAAESLQPEHGADPSSLKSEEAIEEIPSTNKWLFAVAATVLLIILYFVLK